MSEIPTFGLADIPDDWEIELADDFVKFLDSVNRPWKYNPDGTYNPKGRHTPGQSAVFWEAGYYAACRPRYRKLRTTDYFRRHNFFEKLWGYHRYHDAHVARYGYIKETDTGNWILKSELDLIKEVSNMTGEDFEEVIVGLRKGIWSTNVRQLKFNRLPVLADKWWAWLLGLYFSVGSIYFRDRRTHGATIRMRVQEPIVPMVADVIRNIGAKFVLLKGAKSKAVKDFGLGTTTRRTLHLGWPEYLVLTKMGLPTDFVGKDTRQSASRSIRPKIPNWVKNNDILMKAFLEGFINGKGQSFIALSKFKNRRPIPHLFIFLRMSGRPEEYVKTFLLDIKKWFEKQGLTSYFRKIEYYRGARDHVLYELSFQDSKSRSWFLTNFEIRRLSLRARLLLLQRADTDPILYEILRKLHSPDDVVLGMILECSRSQEHLEESLQMTRKGIIGSLQSLETKGVITKSGNIYRYNPERFRQKVITENSELEKKLEQQIAKYSTSMLYKCEVCSAIHTKSEVCCGELVAPLLREEVLPLLTSKLHGTRRILRKLKRR